MPTLPLPMSTSSSSESSIFDQFLNPSPTTSTSTSTSTSRHVADLSRYTSTALIPTTSTSTSTTTTNDADDWSGIQLKVPQQRSHLDRAIYRHERRVYGRGGAPPPPAPPAPANSSFSSTSTSTSTSTKRTISRKIEQRIHTEQTPHPELCGVKKTYDQEKKQKKIKREKDTEKEDGDSSDDELDDRPDPFYDPDQDDADEAWVQQRKRRSIPRTVATCDRGRSIVAPPSTSPSPSTSTSTSTSTSHLTCPACFTILCLDFQRHDTYTNQYRAMYAENVIITDTPTRPVKGDDDYMTYVNVECATCNTVVGVYDSEQTYHFYNVLDSIS